MKLEELILKSRNRAWNRAFPTSIEVSLGDLAKLVADWKSSESSRVEVGRTMSCKISETNEVLIRLSDRVAGAQDGRSIDIPKLKGDNEFAEFHTHPTDPDIGKFYNHRVYQPPSMPDVGRIATNFSDKALAISFVAVSPREIYAVVFLRGLTSADGNRLSAEADTFSGTMKDFVFQQNKITKEAWLDYVSTESKKDWTGKSIEARMDKLTRETPGYGTESARVTAEQLYDICHELQFGLYKGMGSLQKINTRNKTSPNPAYYRAFDPWY